MHLTDAFRLAGICLMGIGALHAQLPEFTSSGTKAPEDNAPRTLSFADRVTYQKAIEEVYWRHRIWPRGNASAKPPLDAVISRERLEQKVRDYLHQSQFISDHRGWSVTTSELQGEINRMASHTKRPEMLRELFEALGNDPFLIAQCLAMPVVTDRLIRDVKNRRSAAIDRTTPSPYDSRNFIYRLPKIVVPTGSAGNMWTATTSASAPDARSGHTAIWTGSEMIIWGGAFLNNGWHNLNTGGRYDPTTDLWTPTRYHKCTYPPVASHCRVDWE